MNAILKICWMIVAAMTPQTPPQIVETDIPTNVPGAWQLWDYAVASRCAWKGNRAGIADFIDTALKAGAQIDFPEDVLRCTRLNSLAPGPFNRQKLINALVLQAYQNASRCAVGQLTNWSIADVQDEYRRFRANEAGYDLPSEIRGAIASCDNRIFAWYAAQRDIDSQILATLIGRQKWDFALRDLAVDPARQSPADKFALCVLSKNSDGVIAYLLMMGRVSGDRLVSRSEELLPEVSDGCDRPENAAGFDILKSLITFFKISESPDV